MDFNQDDILRDKLFDASANSIWHEMNKQRDRGENYKEKMRKRWVWELIQNASDCTGEKGYVNIDILVKDDELIFTHDGIPFSYKNLIDLVTQISSKEEDGDDKTGKFGTGFITTHMISEIVTLHSGLIAGDGISPFVLTIDRSGQTRDEIKKQTETMLNHVHEIMKAAVPQDDMEQVTTKFHYPLHPDSIKTINAGIEDLEKLVPFTLAFNKNIKSITVNGIKYFIENEQKAKTFELCTVRNSNGLITSILKNSKSEIDIAILLEKIHEKNSIKSYSEKTPKLFCKFPLIGTEEFSFPVIINSKTLYVEKDRDGILEDNRDNISVIMTSIELYKELLGFANEKDWSNLFNLCLFGSDTSVLQEKIKDRLNDFILYQDMIDVNHKSKYYKKISFMSKQGDPQIYIPYCNKNEFMDDTWDVLNKFTQKFIPIKESFKKWMPVLNNNYSIKSVNNFLKDQTLEGLSKHMDMNIVDTLEWLKDLYDLLMKLIDSKNFLNEVYVLTQFGDFEKLSRLYINNAINDDLLDLLSDLDSDIKNELVHKKFSFLDNILSKKYDNVYISKEIEEKINKLLADENISNSARLTLTQQLFNRLTNWFIENPELSKELFPKLYERQGLLSPIEKQLERFKIADKVESHNIEMEQLDEIFNNHKMIEMILREYPEGMPKEVVEQLRHKVTSNEVFLKSYHEKRDRARLAVYECLTVNESYKVSETFDDWLKNKHSDSVFHAIRTNDESHEEDILVVVRPSDNDMIVFYHEEELQALDSGNFELWTSNGKITEMITLGDLLMTTGITRIPLKKLF